MTEGRGAGKAEEGKDDIKTMAVWMDEKKYL